MFYAYSAKTMIRTERITTLEVSKDDAGNLVLGAEDGAVSKITQAEDHFVIVKDQASKGLHWITTYVGSLSPDSRPLAYRGNYVLICYRKNSSGWFTSTEKGNFTMTLKADDTKNKEPNQALEPTTMAVTLRAPSRTKRASHGRGSS